MRTAMLLMLLCTPARAADTEPAAALTRVLQKIRLEMAQIPNYTCVETIARTFQQPVAPIKRACEVMLELKKRPTLDMQLRLVYSDRLRLEVGMSPRGEMHAWVGAKEFEEEGRIDSLVRHGPVGTGMFGSFLKAIFDQDVKRFRFEKAVTTAGQVRLSYTFEVPQVDSHYKVKLPGDTWAMVGYRGTVEVDPARDEVRKIQIQTEVMPEAVGTCRTTTDLELAMTAIGSGRFPMATSARQHFVASDGNEAVNAMQFSACREYRGESKITFSAEEPRAAAAAAEATVLAIPPYTPFTMALSEEIDPRTAAAGDIFVARLTSAMEDEKGKTIAPKGARIEGRLLRVEIAYRPTTETIVVLRPESVEIRGARVPLVAKQDMRKLTAAWKKNPKLQILLPFEWEANAALLRFPGEKAVAPKGLESDWRTVGR